MHQTRSAASKKIPVPRKGTRYLVRTSGFNDDSVSVLVAVRDMLHLARTAREVNEMVKDKMLKLNGAIVRDYHEAVRLFNVLEAHKKYKLTLTPTGRFTLVETKTDNRIGKVVGKKIQNKGAMQFNLHDGTNFISKESIVVGDSIEVDVKNKPVKVIPLAKAKHVFIFEGKNKGREAKLTKVEHGKVHLEMEGRSVTLDAEQVIAL